jgi:ABC-2 type transport system permease protein
VGSCMSAVSKSQVIAIIHTASVCLVFVLAGFPMVLNVFKDWLPLLLVDTVASLSFMTHFGAITKGVLGLNDLLYFLSVILFWLLATTVVVEMKQAR